MPRILYDHQIFSFQRFGGISRYFTELIDHVNRDEMASTNLPFPFIVNEYLARSTFYRPWWVYRGANRRVRQWAQSINRRTCMRALKQGGFDIFHPTYYENYFLSDLDCHPMVLTVVDMVPEMLPEQFENNPHRDKRKLAEAASAIIAISENTKNDIVSSYGIAPERIQVVNLASSIFSKGTSRSPSNLALPARYMLFVGNRGRYKNFPKFSKAAANLMARHSDLSLVCVGGGPFVAADMEAFEEAGSRNRVHWMEIDENALPTVYSNAEVFVFPSLYEGFGLPILESFDCHCPVALSDRGCFPEIAADAAVYFDPADVDSMFQSIGEILCDSSLRHRLVERGEQRAKDFSWQRTARETVEVYRSLL